LSSLASLLNRVVFVSDIRGLWIFEPAKIVIPLI
jgi:hypothetical protein